MTPAEVLLAIADQMDADAKHLQERRAVMCHGPGDMLIPAAYGPDLILRAVLGPEEEHRVTWQRMLREDLAAAITYSNTQLALMKQVSALVFPDGTHCAPLGPDTLRTLAASPDHTNGTRNT